MLLMPEWLLKKDDYIPVKQKDAFIDKSILSVLNVLTRLRLQTENKKNRFGINAPVKLLSMMILIIFAAVSRSFLFIAMIDVFLLLVVSLLEADEIKYIMKMGVTVSVFTLIILLPSILAGNISNSILIVLKVIATITTVNITSCTTKWSDAVNALKIVFIPDIFIFVLDITIKYIVIFGEFALNMLYSLKLRSIGKSRDKKSSLSGIIGTLFLKSKEMSEEMYGAMECRGFTGQYKAKRKFRICFNDILCVIISIMFIFAYFYFDRL